ncbi:DUF4439 domain-containing protein [Dietzia sp.]|uniref:DUF4439 domain-containing protein n=1 Tax=Dietzia sp. TaxID=1871616 RepID=UPI002FDAE623
MTDFPGIRGEQAAAYGYGLLLPLADPSVLASMRRQLDQHRDFADRALALWPDAPAPQVGYSLDQPPANSGDSLLLAIRLESDACEGWAAQLARPDQTEAQKALALECLRAGSVQMARWRTLVSGAPLTPLPGLG